jgi:uncharacterized protein YukE
MTNDDMERAFDFLLKSQANLEMQIEQTNRQLGEFADTQADFIRVMTGTWEAQAEINSSFRAAQRTQEKLNDSFRAAIETLAVNDKNLTAAFRELAAAQVRTEGTVEKLAQKVDRLVDAWGGSARE